MVTVIYIYSDHTNFKSAGGASAKQMLTIIQLTGSKFLNVSRVHSHLAWLVIKLSLKRIQICMSD